MLYKFFRAIGPTDPTMAYTANQNTLYSGKISVSVRKLFEALELAARTPKKNNAFAQKGLTDLRRDFARFRKMTGLDIRFGIQLKP